MTDRPLRILHVLNTVRELGNGIINTAMDLAWGQAQLGHDVSVASGGGEFESRLAEWKVRHHTLDQRRTPLVLLAAARHLRALLRDERPDVVHCHMMTGVVLARAVRGTLPVTIVGHVHNVYQKSARLMGLADAVLCCGTAVRETMRGRGVPDARLHVVLNGTIGTPRLPDPQHVAPAPIERPAIVTVAGLSARKGIDELLATFARIAPRVPGAHLHIVGDGPERARLQRIAAEGPAAARIHFHGFQRDPTPFLRAADLFVLASRRESFPIVIGEARAAGCAIIATAVDGVPESLDGGRAGLLVPAQDVSALAAACERLLLDDAERARWARASAEGIAHYRVERMVAETVALYRTFR